MCYKNAFAAGYLAAQKSIEGEDHLGHAAALEMLAKAARWWQGAREYAMAAHVARLPAETQQEAANVLMDAEDALADAVATLAEIEGVDWITNRARGDAGQDD